MRGLDREPFTFTNTDERNRCIQVNVPWCELTEFSPTQPRPCTEHHGVSQCFIVETILCSCIELVNLSRRECDPSFLSKFELGELELTLTCNPLVPIVLISKDTHINAMIQNCLNVLDAVIDGAIRQLTINT